MEQTSQKPSLLFKDGVIGRDPSQKATDISALNAIVQAAVNVELFTIPLYMSALYSLQGTHAINSNNDFYLGRVWPGMSTTANPQTDNETAFNAIFSVFIAEMLHLQLASNICQSVGVKPNFTSPALQDSQYGWTCYGPSQTVIPHIINLQDTIAPYNQLVVNLDSVNPKQIDLFLAIEETEAHALTIIDPDKIPDYFPIVPFAGWQPSYNETNLPLFGAIGHMYKCLWEYLSIHYSDGTTLWDTVYQQNVVQQDIFNGTGGSHQPEYPGMSTVVNGSSSEAALLSVLNMIDGITDQGEGQGVVQEIKARAGYLAATAVQQEFQPDAAALEADYPSYTPTGGSAPSADAAARVAFGSVDHYDTFLQIADLLSKGNIVTWDQWHAQGNSWTAQMLETPDYSKNTYPLPSSDDIAGALNRLKNDPQGNNYTLISQAAVGAIAGITTVLNTFWQNPTGQFPYPSMAGSGDRMSICWAIFGKAPNLALGVPARQQGVLYHACQGLNLDPSQPNDPAVCAAIEVYHTCRGSNQCKAEGGCGFVQSVNGGGGGCSSKVGYAFPGRYQKDPAKAPAPGGVGVEGTCGLPPMVSAPSDNKCGTLGGCAVPISASQMYPAPNPSNTVMELFTFPSPDFTPQGFSTLSYQSGDLVYDVAWKAYCEVLQQEGQPVPTEKPAPSDLRLAFPPST